MSTMRHLIYHRIHHPGSLNWFSFDFALNNLLSMNVTASSINLDI